MSAWRGPSTSGRHERLDPLRSSPPSHSNGRPGGAMSLLLLAPMEGLLDHPLREAG